MALRLAESTEQVVLERGHPVTDGPLAVLEDVTYRYAAGVTALENLSLEVARSSVLSIIGPSGCGKSTMLALLAGLDVPTTGAISWNDAAVSREAAVAMVFQKDTLLPWLTVAENVRFPLKLRHTSRKDSKPRVDDLLQMVGLTSFARAYPYQLSGGMRRRVAFASAVAPSPSLLLLDEPFSSLDEPTRIGVHADVYRVICETQMTVVLVTHDLAEAISLSDEVAILSARPGHVIERVDVPFDRDRDIASIRQDPDFLALYGRLWGSLSEEIKRANAP